MAMFSKKKDSVTKSIEEVAKGYLGIQSPSKLFLDDIKPIEMKSIEIESAEDKKPDADEWIWVKGYKGTDKDMCCRDYQFDLDRQFDMPEGAPIETCESGFHFCRDLKNVFNYYDVGSGNRFFEVRALVRKKDYVTNPVQPTFENFLRGLYGDKLTSKSIIFVRELTQDEVLSEKIDSDTLALWTEADKKLCMREGEKAVEESRKRYALTALGYSATMASYIVGKTDKFDLALALGSQDELTMYDRCFLLFGHA